MSQPPEEHNPWQSFVQPWTDAWLKWLEDNREHQSVLSACVPEGMDFATARQHWLDALSRHLDTTMRSPAFLESMQRNLQAWADLQMRLKSSGGESTPSAAAPVASETTTSPPYEELRSLLVRLQASQEVMIARLREVERRVAALERVVNAATPPSHDRR